MNQNDLYRAIGEIDDKFIAEAEKGPQNEDQGLPAASEEAFGAPRRRNGLQKLRGGWGKWVAIAACAALAIGIALPLATRSMRMGSGASMQSAKAAGGTNGAVMQMSTNQAAYDSISAEDLASESESVQNREEPKDPNCGMHEGTDTMASGSTSAAGGSAGAASSSGSTAGDSKEASTAEPGAGSSSSGSASSGSSYGTQTGGELSASGDYPAAIMIEGIVYYATDRVLEKTAIDESAVLGVTSSYTDAMPEKDGETNFLRETGARYAGYQGGIAVQMQDGSWLVFLPKE